MYDITYFFIGAFLHPGDRTRDQMLQAARSGKQNIVEGSADGVMSSEMELKLLNVARGSIQELQEDYVDFASVRSLPVWGKEHPRYDALLKFCRTHNAPEDYMPLLRKKTAGEIVNVAVTLTHMVDKMMMSYQKRLEERFLKEGGLRERMTAARIDIRTRQRQSVEDLQKENQRLRDELEKLRNRSTL